MALRKIQIPDKLKPLVLLGVDYNPAKMAGDQFYGICPFCYGADKFYINVGTGQWDCKRCSKKGNEYTFLEYWYKARKDETDSGDYVKEFKKLSEDRKLPVEALINGGIVFDEERFWIPVRNIDNKIINLLHYDLFHPLPSAAKKHTLWSLPTLSVGLYNVEKLKQKGRENEKCFIVEGPWDAIALEFSLEEEGKKGIVLGCPGKDSWKAVWSEYVKGRGVTLCFDKGVGADRGHERIYSHIHKEARYIDAINWPESLPEGYDLRDLLTDGEGTVYDIEKMLDTYISPTQVDKIKDILDIKKLAIDSPDRPTWEEVKKVYSKHLSMSRDHWDALKIIFATMLTTSIEGDALWMYIVGPPGCGKTTLIMSASKVSIALTRSTLSPNSLMSGFAGPKDPSLLAIVDGKCLLVKDATEILSQARDDKAKIFSTLRGAYDKEIHYTYGNGVARSYNAHFNALFAVTSSIYAEQTSQLGDRFLFYHLSKNKSMVNLRNIDSNPVRMAIKSVGKDRKMETELSEIATKFLEVEVTKEDLPDISDDIVGRLIGLANFTSVLRTAPERDLRQNRKLVFRPETESAARIGKQLAKLCIGLGLIKNPPTVDQDDLRIATRVALDSCIGFNLEAIGSLVANPRQTMLQLSDDCNLAYGTMRDQVEDLIDLGAVDKEEGEKDGAGRRPMLYSPSRRLLSIWHTAGLERVNRQVRAVQRKRASEGLQVVRVGRK